MNSNPESKIRLLPVFAAMILIFSACTPAGYRVGLFSYNNDDPYIRNFVDQIQAARPDYILLETYDAENSQVLQNEQLEAALANPPAVAIINPVDRLGVFGIVNSFREQNVPIIFFNREPLPRDMALWDRVYYIGARAEQSGVLQAELAAPLFGPDPDNLNELDRNSDNAIQAVILKGETGHQDAETRTAVVRQRFAELGYTLDVLALESANWNGDQAYRIIDELIPLYKDQIELILSNNDAMALGAIRRLRQADFYDDSDGNGLIDRSIERWIPVVGIDGLPEAEQAIAEGYLYGTVQNDSASMSRAIIELAEVLMGRREESEMSYSLEGRYIWIDYLPYTSE